MIEVRNLHKSFDDFHVLKGVDLLVEEGETLALLGPSGTGKSVLIKHVMGLLEPDGALVHVSDRKDVPEAGDSAYPLPTPPFAAMRELVTDYLGPLQRAGQGVLRYGSPDGEATILRAAGFAEPEHLRVPAGGVMRRSEDDLVAWVYSLSGSAPHLFGDRHGAFERELRAVLRRASPSGWFNEQPPDTEVFVWRKTAR